MSGRTVETATDPAPRILALLGVVLAATVLTGTVLVLPELVLAGVGSVGVRVALVLEPFARGAAQLAACGTLGALLLAAGPVRGPGGPGERLPASALALVRAAGRWATVWVVAAVALTVLRLVSVDGFFAPRLHQDIGLDAVSVSARAAVVMAWFAAVVAVLTRTASSRRQVTGVLALAVAAMLPAALSGHAVHSPAPVLTVGTLLVHLTALSLWTGGLLVLLVHGSAAVQTPALLRWFSKVALLCYAAVAASGTVNALTVTGWSELREGGAYPVLLGAKVLLLLLLGGFGWRHRRRTLPAAEAGDHGAFRRLVAVEAVVLVVALALGVVLAGAT